MEKIADKNVSRARTALDMLIKEAKACEDREELHKKAVAIFSRELSDLPQLAERACEAFNSNKSQYKFASGFGKGDVSGDFSLLDPVRVAEDIRNVKKVASVKKFEHEKFAAKFYANEAPADSEPMQKAASAEVFNPADCIELDTRPAMFEVTVSNILNHQRDMITKLACAVDDAKAGMIKTQDPLAREVSHLSKKAAGEAVSIAQAHYGKLFDSIREFFPKDIPLMKFASEPMIPNTPIFDKIASCMEKEYVYNNMRVLFKQAAADITATLRKLAGEYNLAKKSLPKTAGVFDTMTGAALAPSLREALDLDAGKKDELYDKVLNQNVQNVLRELETKRNFYEVYADDYISTFPVDDVQIAYNNAIQKLPESLRKHPSSATQLVRSWVIKMLSRGSVTSAEDASDVMEAADKLRNEARPRNPYKGVASVIK